MSLIQRPVSALCDTESVQRQVAELLAVGCRSEGSFSSGHVCIRAGGTIVYRALQPAPFNPWTVERYNARKQIT